MNTEQNLNRSEPEPGPAVAQQQPANATPDEGWLEWTKAELSSRWNQAEKALGEASDGLGSYVRAPSHGVPAHGAEAPGAAAQIYRLDHERSCGSANGALHEPWSDLAANYWKPVSVDAHSLAEVAAKLDQAGTPLRPGDVVSLNGTHVFSPAEYAASITKAPAAASWWHQLATPEMAAVAGGTFVAIKAVNYMLEPERPRTIVEHGR